MNYVLSNQDLEYIILWASRLSFAISERWAKDLQKVIDAFSDETIVQNFYNSGIFGQDKYEQLTRIKNALIEYSAVISGENGLVHNTRKYCENLMMLNNSTGYGSSVNASVSSGVSMRKSS